MKKAKKLTAMILCLMLAASCMTACSDSGNNSSQNSSAASSSQSSDNISAQNSNGGTSEASGQTVVSNMFADGDYQDVTSSDADATITLSGNSGTISDTTRGSSGSEVTITSKGTYRVTGSSENVTIVIDDDNQSGNIYLILDNVAMTNSAAPCINVKACDKLIIQCVGSNSLTMSNSDENADEDAAIYSKDDVSINGNGTLNIVSSLHGVFCKKDLKITGAELSINAQNIGIKSKDSIRIGGGKTTIVSGHDAVQVTNDSNDSIFYCESGELLVTAGYDGIAVTSQNDSADFTGSINICGGKINITAGGGSDNSKNKDTSQKGIKCAGKISITNAEINISSADDALHGKNDIIIGSGNITLSTSDDGITASGKLTVSDGTVNVNKSYEGLEATEIEINGGDLSIISSDDGINTAGGSDSSSSEGPWGSSSDDSKLTINGGNVYVNANGDGLDSNGSIYVTGGTVIVEGSTANDNGALDKGDGQNCVLSVTGGTVLAIGASGMAINFDSGTQCSALVSISGNAGDAISVDDGSGFTYTATKNFDCAVYTSPSMSQGSTYTMTAGSASATLDFSSGMYYSDLSAMGRGPGGNGRGPEM